MSLVNAEELRGCRLPRARLRAARERDHPGDRRARRRARRQGRRVRRRRPTRATDVYFAVRAFPGYGKLSHRNVDDLRRGRARRGGRGEARPARLRAVEGARRRTALGLGQPVGQGAAGLAHRVLGDGRARRSSPHFDVHGGGMDLIFPHHENEIAQSEAAWGEPFARRLDARGLPQVDAEKMSKSLGNFVTIAAGARAQRRRGAALLPARRALPRAR